MSLRLVPTPLEVPVREPAPRAGGLDPSLADAFVPSPARDQLLERLRQPGALAVTSGQQPGLFTGPLYTVHKALSTAALARVLERRWDRPVVPIFWSAGDDHDFAEAIALALFIPDAHPGRPDHRKTSRIPHDSAHTGLQGIRRPHELNARESDAGHAPDGCAPPPSRPP